MSDERAVAHAVAASPEADAAASERLARLVDLLRREAGDRLCGVVLSGSLSRGEGVVVKTPAGLALLSDIDLYAVLDPVDPAADAALAAQARRLCQDDPFLLAPLDLGLVAADHFDRLGPTLPARQLAHGHRVLWSSDRPWSRPGPQLGIGPVDPDDAAKLLHNRCAEHVLLRGRAQASRTGLFRSFHRWKTWMDAPLAFLAAYDLYEADRQTQIETLARLAKEGPGATQIEPQLQRLRAMRQAVSAPLSPSQLAELAADDRELYRWVWPFHRALLRRGLGRGDAAATWRSAVQAGPPCAADARLQRRWLRRRGPWATMREARRWAPLAGTPVTPWWRHGGGGTGPDRVHLAAVDRFVQSAWWQEPLRGLIDPPVTDEAGLDAWLGGLWSSWIMGGARQ